MDLWIIILCNFKRPVCFKGQHDVSGKISVIFDFSEGSDLLRGISERPIRLVNQINAFYELQKK
jgi:hypothetical protein